MQFCSYLNALNINNSGFGFTGMAGKMRRGGTVCALNRVGKKIRRACVVISSALEGIQSIRGGA